LIKCSKNARKPIAVPVRKLSVYLKPFRRSSFLECALQPKITKINMYMYMYLVGVTPGNVSGPPH